METQLSLETKFIPNRRSSPLPELYAIFASFKEEIAQLHQERKQLRSRLALKIRATKKKARLGAVRNALREEKIALMHKAIEVESRAKEILRDSYLEALSTIKSVCLAFIAEDLELNDRALLIKLRHSFQELDKASVIRIDVAPGSNTALQALYSEFAEIKENTEIKPGCAVINTRSGSIQINFSKDLEEAFSQLRQKLLDAISLSEGDKHSSI